MVEEYLIWSSIITSIATVVLAIVTIFYVVFTGKMLKEMKKTREAEIEPALEAFLVPFGPTNVVLEIRNVGRGAARDIVMDYKYEDSEDKSKKWKWSILSPNDSKRFGTPDGNLDLENLSSSNKILIVTLSYVDLLKKRYNKRITIDFSSVKGGWYGSDMLLEDSLIDHAKKIEKNLGGIAKSFTPFGLKVKKETDPKVLEKLKNQIKKGNKQK